MAFMSTYTGGHELRPHLDPELARKGWLYCYNCFREVHGTERTGGNWDECDPTCKCKHKKSEHKTQPSGAIACCHFGCGCSDFDLKGAK